MNLLEIIKGFEELIFEITTWLRFYPVTLWRIIRRPLATMEYSDQELTEPEEGRYDDALSPPLTLLITVVLANVLAVVAHVPPAAEAVGVAHVARVAPEVLVVLRSLTFCLVPLISALTLLQRQGRKVSRETLRPPFYAQCYLAAPCAALMLSGSIVFQRPDIPNVIGVAGMIAGAVWFITAQSRWFRKQLQLSWLNAVLTALWAEIRALLYLGAVLVPVALL